MAMARRPSRGFDQAGEADEYYISSLREKLTSPSRDVDAILLLCETFCPRLTENFAGMDLAEIAQTMQWVDLSAGEVICKEGDEADCLYYILYGVVSVYRHDPQRDKREVLLPEQTQHGDLVLRIAEGKFFGELAFLSNQHFKRRTATVVAGPPQEEIEQHGAADIHKLTSGAFCIQIPRDGTSKEQLFPGDTETKTPLKILSQKIDFLSGLFLFSHWHPTRRNSLAYATSIKQLNKNQTLHRTGHMAGMTIGVISGGLLVVKRIEVSLHDPRTSTPTTYSRSKAHPLAACTSRVEVALLRKGDLWGMCDLLPSSEEDCELMAQVDSELLCIPKVSLQLQLHDDPKAMQMIEILAENRKEWEESRIQCSKLHQRIQSKLTWKSMELSKYRCEPKNCLSPSDYELYRSSAAEIDQCIMNSRKRYRTGVEAMRQKEFYRAFQAFQESCVLCKEAIAMDGFDMYPRAKTVSQHFKTTRTALSLACEWHATYVLKMQAAGDSGIVGMKGTASMVERMAGADNETCEGLRSVQSRATLDKEILHRALRGVEPRLVDSLLGSTMQLLGDKPGIAKAFDPDSQYQTNPPPGADEGRSRQVSFDNDYGAALGIAGDSAVNAEISNKVPRVIRAANAELPQHQGDISQEKPVSTPGEIKTRRVPVRPAAPGASAAVACSPSSKPAAARASRVLRPEGAAPGE